MADNVVNRLIKIWGKRKYGNFYLIRHKRLLIAGTAVNIFGMWLSKPQPPRVTLPIINKCKGPPALRMPLANWGIGCISKCGIYVSRSHLHSHWNICWLNLLGVWVSLAPCQATCLGKPTYCPCSFQRSRPTFDFQASMYVRGTIPVYLKALNAEKQRIRIPESSTRIATIAWTLATAQPKPTLSHDALCYLFASRCGVEGAIWGIDRTWKRTCKRLGEGSCRTRKLFLAGKAGSSCFLPAFHAQFNDNFKRAFLLSCLFSLLF